MSNTFSANISDEQALALALGYQPGTRHFAAGDRKSLTHSGRARYAAMLAVSGGGAEEQVLDKTELHILMDRNAWRAAMIGLCNSGKESEVRTPELAAEHLRKRLAARPAQAETAEPSAGKEHWQHVGDLIESALHGYRCQYWQTEEGGGMPLADLLTPTGESSIAFGKAELELLCDHILIELHTALATPSEAMRRDAKRS